jgi:hypothetical protein
MSRIEDSIGRQDEDSGYGRVFGDHLLGQLMSRVHVCAIRNGNELERLLWEATPYKSTLGEILNQTLFQFAQDVHVVASRGIRASDPAAPLTDFLVLDLRRSELAVIEMKDGDKFDTKKADGELASARTFADWIRPRVSYPVSYYFCAFNQTSKAAIVSGIQQRFALNEVLTGQEFCARIGVDYAAIRAQRQHNQEANRRYFVAQLLAIPALRSLVEEQLDQLAAPSAPPARPDGPDGPDGSDGLDGPDGPDDR